MSRGWRTTLATIARGSYERLARVGEHAPHIGCEGALDLHLEGALLYSPKNDLGLFEQRARAHPDRKRSERQIERAAVVDQGRGTRAFHRDGGVAMADVNERVRRVAKRNRQLAGNCR